MDNTTQIAEQFVIGGLLLLGDMGGDQAQKVLAMLKPSSFADLELSVAYDAIGRVAERGGRVDAFSVYAEAQRDKRCSDRLEDYLFELAGSSGSSANIVSYAEAVREKAIERYAVESLHKALAMITDPTAGDVHQRIGRAESVLSALNERSMRTGGLRHVREIGKEWVGQVSAQVEGGVRGFTMGIDALDRLLYPKRVPPGSLVVVGARPKMAKTALMGKIMSHFALKRKEAVACFSLEMPDVQIYERMIVGESGVDPEIFYRAAKDVDDWSRVNAAAKSYNESLLYVDDTPGVRLSHIQREARRLNKQHRIGLVAVDYLTLMDGEGAERNDLAYGKITKSLKNLAKELNCVVLLLSQLNRALESRQDKRPFPSDSRDTGQIEQDCDLWIGLYREGAYTDHPDDDRTEVIVRMNRHGRTGTVYVKQENGAIVETPDQEPRTVDRKPTRVAYGRES
ncbi:MAG: helicase DnaB [Gammaproteobacteria bacterium]|nr:MAG: helicase DnaB [Gammaproteobacteria bacterium]